MRLLNSIWYNCRVKHALITLFILICLILWMNILRQPTPSNHEVISNNIRMVGARNPASLDVLHDGDYMDMELDKSILLGQKQEIARVFEPPVQKSESRKLPSIDLEYKNKYGHYIPPNDTFINYFNRLERIVHLDLKGAPPKLEYLRVLLPYLSKIGATGILMEYEDMFPFDGKLLHLSASNAYNAFEISTILQMAIDNQLEVIPLVQTFGHLEYVLKYERYISLREIFNIPQVITPVNNETYDLLFEILDQVLAKHPGVKRIHIGCDEVYDLGSGRSRSYMLENSLSKDELFLEHVKTVATHLVDEHNVIPIMWDDEMRHLNTTMILNSGLTDLVEPMVWSYTPNLASIPVDVWRTYGKIFKNIWIASAFKGATGSTQYITDTSYHLKNHYAWIDVLKSQGITPGGANFVGVTLTGWQRYDHFGNLCELLPVAIPSLTVCIQAMRNGGFGKHEHQIVSSFLKCSSLIELDPLDDGFFVPECSFPGSEIYNDIKEYHKLIQKYSKNLRQDILKNWMTEYHVKTKFFSSGRLKYFRERLISIIKLFRLVEYYMRKHLPFVYDKVTVEEWISQNIKPFLVEFGAYLKDISLLRNVTFWDKRPTDRGDTNVLQ